MTPIKVEGTITHWDSGIKANQNFSVSLHPDGIRISLQGYGNQMDCVQIELGNNSKEPRVIVWGDSEIDEPTHIISLEDCKDND